MKRREFNEGLCRVDDKLLEEYIEQKEKLLAKKKQESFWVRFGAIAACFVIIASAIILVPMLQNGFTNKLPYKLTGKQEVVFGNIEDDEHQQGEPAPMSFLMSTIVEARVVEILPDSYYIPVDFGYTTQYHIARLSITDLLRGSGHPKEIFFRFSDYPADILNGYDSFIFSIKQVGVENFMMINETKGEISYFPHMFQVAGPENLGYGCVIAFNNGRVDASFYDKLTPYNTGYYKKMYLIDDPERYNFPADRNSTVYEVKKNIQALVIKWNEETADRVYAIKPFYDYYTAEDIFISNEGKKAQGYINDEANCFTQSITINDDRILARFTRIINGFTTDERISVNDYSGENGNVLHVGGIYSAEDISNAPDIGSVIEKLNLAEIEPPHVDEANKFNYKGSVAKGFYRKINGKTYGIVRILWYYKDLPLSDNMYATVVDHLYYLYDSEGNVSIIERDELREMIGNDAIVDGFYGFDDAMDDLK
jgi:hypothetical protein